MTAGWWGVSRPAGRWDGWWARLPGRLRDELPYGVQVMKSAAAAGAAYGLATVVAPSQPVTAAIAAMLTVQVSVTSTLAQAARRLVGVVAGVLFAALVHDQIGHGWLGIALVTAISLLIGRVLGLGVVGAVQVPVNALWVFISAGLHAGLATVGAVDAVLGTLIGVAVVGLASPPVYLRPAVEAAAAWAEGIRQVVAGMAADLAGRSDLPMSDSLPAGHDWLAAARAIVEVETHARRLLTHAHDELRMHPAGSSEAFRAMAARLAALDQVAQALEHTGLQVRSVARGLVDAILGAGEHPVPLLSGLPELFVQLATALSLAGTLIVDPTDSPARERLRVVTAEAARSVHRCVEAATALLEQPSPPADWEVATMAEPWLIYGAVLANLARAVDELDPQEGPHAEGWSPPAPVRPGLFTRVVAGARSGRPRLPAPAGPETP